MTIVNSAATAVMPAFDLVSCGAFIVEDRQSCLSGQAGLPVLHRPEAAA